LDGVLDGWSGHEGIDAFAEDFNIAFGVLGDVEY